MLHIGAKPPSLLPINDPRSASFKENRMSVDPKSPEAKKNWLLSLDSWAVVAAFVAALLIRVGVLKHVPW
jgi:hypothetical protein